MTADARIGGLFVYPVKGCAAVSLAEAIVTRRGLQHDRRWAVTTPTGRVLTQREVAALGKLRCWFNADGSLGLMAGAERLDAPQPGTGHDFRVRVWSDDVGAEAYDDPVDDALSALLEQPVRLVHFPEGAHRACDPHYATAAETAFADGFPLLITSEATLVWLDERLLEIGGLPVPMSRFRPNIVLEGVPVNAEDEHQRLTAQDGLVVDLVKPCDRCVVTTIDQETATPDGDQPLALLRQIRRHPLMRQPVFGQNGVPKLAPGATGRLRVGQQVRLEGSART